MTQSINVDNGERVEVSFVGPRGGYSGFAGVEKPTDGSWRVCFLADRKALAGTQQGIVGNTPVSVTRVGTSSLAPAMVELIVEPRLTAVTGDDAAP